MNINNIFIDTSGFFAYLVKKDAKHKRARDLIQKTLKDNGRLITTDYVIDETATLLKARKFNKNIPNLFDNILESKLCNVEWMDQELFIKTKTMFIKYNDHEWSFTDCFSFIIMKKLRINNALTTDTHFNEGGYFALLA